MDDEFDDWIEETPCARFMPLDAAVIGVGLLRDLAGSVEHALTLTQQFVMGHANWVRSRDAFAVEAALEIETLIGGADG